MLSVPEQLTQAKKRVAAKNPDGRYIAYFQDHTNTYAPVSYLEPLFRAAIRDPEVAVLSVATRPDCLPADVLELLSRLNAEKPVWIELGLQTAREDTARAFGRGYELPVYDEAMATSLRNEMYVKSSELLGASKAHILFKEILPNCTGSILTKATLDMGWVILTGATLSFVGLGEQPPTPALGTMVSDGAKYLPTQWWISIFPALAIMLIVLGFNLMGDGVKDMLSGKE